MYKTVISKNEGKQVFQLTALYGIFFKKKIRGKMEFKSNASYKTYHCICYVLLEDDHRNILMTARHAGSPT